MDKRLQLHSELLKFHPNAYFQPPSTITMKYPCVVYNKTGKVSEYGNNGLYMSNQEYQLTVIETDPDSTVADDIEGHFDYCKIQRYYTTDSLNHTTINLIY